MSGHVFHPGHQELHGVTVVLEATGGRTYVGRFHTQDAAGVQLLDVAVHDAASADVPKDEFIRRTAKFGVRSERKHLVVPNDEVQRITRLGEMT